jgi:hypothetical protein
MHKTKLMNPSSMMPPRGDLCQKAIEETRLRSSFLIRSFVCEQTLQIQVHILNNCPIRPLKHLSHGEMMPKDLSSLTVPVLPPKVKWQNSFRGTDGSILRVQAHHDQGPQRELNSQDTRARDIPGNGPPLYPTRGHRVTSCGTADAHDNEFRASEDEAIACIGQQTVLGQTLKGG